jgi:protein gp37
MNETEINWTDLTWNAASGCTKVSPECAHCYAETLAENKRGTRAFPVGFDVTMRPWKLDEPRLVKKPSLIFTNSMTDMFHEEITDDYREKICETMEKYPQHRYQTLTKRPEIAAAFFKRRPVPASMWLGCTVGVRRTTDRIAILQSIAAPVRFLSCEPLLEELRDLDLSGISWVIGGGESGSHASDEKILKRRFLVRRGDRANGEALWMPREDRLHFARSLRDQTKAAGAAFWWKQHGGPRPTSGGRILDGRTWDEMPTHVAGAMPTGHVMKDLKHKVQLELVAS